MLFCTFGNFLSLQFFYLSTFLVKVAFSRRLIRLRNVPLLWYFLFSFFFLLLTECVCRLPVFTASPTPVSTSSLPSAPPDTPSSQSVTTSTNRYTPPSLPNDQTATVKSTPRPSTIATFTPSHLSATPTVLETGSKDEGTSLMIIVIISMSVLVFILFLIIMACTAHRLRARQRARKTHASGASRKELIEDGRGSPGGVPSVSNEGYEGICHTACLFSYVVFFLVCFCFHSCTCDCLFWNFFSVHRHRAPDHFQIAWYFWLLAVSEHVECILFFQTIAEKKKRMTLFSEDVLNEWAGWL